MPLHFTNILSPKISMVIIASIIGLTAPLAAYGQSAIVDEGPFLEENATAMDKMMVEMAVKPTGNVDFDFAAMMIPHHQGAIDMALAELRYGKNEQLRRIAQEIVVEQQQEIIAMRLALNQPLPPSSPAQTQALPNSPAAPAAFERPSISHNAMSMSSSITK